MATRSGNVVGLDIGATAVRAVELSGGNKAKPNLLRFHEISLPVGAVVRGEVIDSGVVEVALKRLWSQGGFKSKSVVLGTGNQRTMVRELSVPPGSLKHIRESLPFQAQSLLQMPLEDSLLDFYPISDSTDEHAGIVNGLLIATEKNPILHNIRTAEKAGLVPIEVDLIPFALARLLVCRAQVTGTVALIDVGAKTTSIVVVINGVPNFVRIIPAGGDDLTQAFKTELVIDLDRAENLKRGLRVGSDVASKDDAPTTNPECTCAKCLADVATPDDPRVQVILRTVTTELLGSLRNTISYFNNMHPEDLVGEVHLTGGGTHLSGFADALASMVHIPIVEADPFAMITPSRKLDLHSWQESSTNYSVALGLALRSMS